MNRRPIFRFIVLITLLVLTAIWWVRSTFPDAGVPEGMDNTTAGNQSQTGRIPGTPLTPQKEAKKGLSKRDAFSLLPILTSARIEFYGKVIDQDGKPMAGVEVLGGTGSTTGFMQEETRRYFATTDANGLFSFRGFSGDALIVVPKKEGYNFSSDRNRFAYAPMGSGSKRFVPERGKPVVFQMWKSLGAEPLIDYHAHSVDIPIDGTPVLIDLKKGAKAQGEGDLLISIIWGPRSDPKSYAFDWSVKLEVAEGGIMESKGDVMFIAPLEGYQKSLEYHFTAQDRRGNFESNFYIMSRNESIFSRAQIYFQNNPMLGNADATFRVQLNPKPGSRNLEGS